MRTTMLVATLGFLATSPATAHGAAATAGQATLSKQEASEGFVSLFDGRSLAGWRGATEGYLAQDGVLTCTKAARGNLLTLREFGDFVFRFEFKLEPGGNNGVSVRGHEIQILDDDAPKHKNLKPCQYHGSIYCLVPAKRGHTKPPGQWNNQEIACQGSRWKVTVNGAVVVDVDLAHVPGAEALAKRTKGPLGFKSHAAHVQFRNLRVKEL